MSPLCHYQKLIWHKKQVNRFRNEVKKNGSTLTLIFHVYRLTNLKKNENFPSTIYRIEIKFSYQLQVKSNVLFWSRHKFSLLVALLVWNETLNDSIRCDQVHHRHRSRVDPQSGWLLEVYQTSSALLPLL